MASARDRSPDLTRTLTGARLPLLIYTLLRSIASPATPPSCRQPKLLDCLRDVLRTHHDQGQIEQSYCHWFERSIFFRNVRHPADMAEPEVIALLTHLALKEKAGARIQAEHVSPLVVPRPLTASVRRGIRRGR